MIKETANLHKKIFGSSLERIPTRNGYGEGVVEAGEKNDKVVVLCADLSESTRSHLFRAKFPKRFIQVGVAEQNMAGISAGLALDGKIPFMASYSVFNPGRNLDQIRTSICYSKANVKIVGSHSGLSPAPDGATHQALEDIAITRSLPNLTVISPADYQEAKKATLESAKHNGPVYIRLARKATPVFTTQDTPFDIKKAQTFMEGRDVTVFSTGPILYEAMRAAHNLRLKHEIICEVVNISTIKPLDKRTVLEKAKKTRKVVVVEEHQVNGGLGGAISEYLGQNYPIPIKIIGVEDTFGESGKYEELLEKYELNEQHIEIKIREFYRKWK